MYILSIPASSIAAAWRGVDSGIPAGCSIRKDGDRRTHLEGSSKGVGKGREDLIPICKTYSYIGN